MQSALTLKRLKRDEEGESTAESAEVVEEEKSLHEARSRHSSISPVIWYEKLPVVLLTSFFPLSDTVLSRAEADELLTTWFGVTCHGVFILSEHRVVHTLESQRTRSFITYTVLPQYHTQNNCLHQEAPVTIATGKGKIRDYLRVYPPLSQQ